MSERDGQRAQARAMLASCFAFVFACTSAPFASSASTTSKWPSLEALWSGVHPFCGAASQATRRAWQSACPIATIPTSLPAPAHAACRAQARPLPPSFQVHPPNTSTPPSKRAPPTLVQTTVATLVLMARHSALPCARDGSLQPAVPLRAAGLLLSMPRPQPTQHVSPPASSQTSPQPHSLR
jgi:hypothetical protein